MTLKSSSSSSSIDVTRGEITESPSGKLEADEPIIRSVSLARSIYESYRAKQIKRSILYTEIDGLIAGNPPYPPEALRDAGLTHMANFNDMSPRAAYERACTAYWNLIHNAKYLTQFHIRTPQKDPQLPIFEETLARHWKFAVLKHWPAFLSSFATLQAQIVKFGVSPAFFHDERDPKWRVIELQKFFVPDQAQADLDALTSVCIESEYPISYLWSIYQEFTDKSGNEKPSSPWKTMQLGKLLIELSKTPNKDGSLTRDAVTIGRKLYSGDISWDNNFSDMVKIVSLFQQEYNKKISHYMFHRDTTKAAAETDQIGEDFLFYNKDQYARMNEALVLFTMNPGEATIHANRGFGHKFFSLAQAKIQLGCSVVDMAKWASTPIVKSSSLSSKDAELIRWYPGAPTNIGSADFVENTMGANIQQVIGTAQYLASQIKENVAYSGQDVSQPDPDVGSLSPSQSRLGAWQEFSVQKNHIMWFYQQCDRLIQLMTTKIFYSKEPYPSYEILKTWRERSIEDGVPEEIFQTNGKDGSEGMPKHLDVTAVRVAGAGSQVAQLMGLQEIGPLVPSFSVRQQKTYSAQMISAALGPEQLDAYNVNENEMDERGGGASLAGVENSIMQMAKSPVFSNDNEHRAHFATHAALARQTIDAVVQQQMDIVQADTIFRVLVPHMGEHLQALSKNIFAKTFFQQSLSVYNQIKRYSDLNAKNAAKAVQARMKKQREDQQNQQQAMNEDQLKNFTTQNEEHRKDYKLAAQTARQKEAGDNKAANLERKTDADIANKRKKTDAEVAIARSKESGKQGESSGNAALDQATNDPSGYLKRIGGQTPTPFDIETPGAPTV